jgi:hypothetical protein
MVFSFYETGVRSVGGGGEPCEYIWQKVFIKYKKQS